MQEALVGALLEDLGRISHRSLQVLVTLNLPERLGWQPEDFSFPVTVLHNDKPRGFGTNHNAAFGQCDTPHFCIINPDIRLETNPFPALLACLNDRNVAAVAPIVFNPQGKIEDSVRHFPSPFGLITKALDLDGSCYPIEPGTAPFAADWVGGMFMLFRATDFAAVGGFDEGFFLYYEDVDICARLWKRGRRVMACPQASVVHDARRASRRDLRYMRWHLSSMGRYFRKHLFRLPAVR
nr:glycosyltransferase family 2 protein [Sulfuriferula plumbiphila]